MVYLTQSMLVTVHAEAVIYQAAEAISYTRAVSFLTVEKTMDYLTPEAVSYHSRACALPDSRGC